MTFAKILYKNMDVFKTKKKKKKKNMKCGVLS